MERNAVRNVRLFYFYYLLSQAHFHRGIFILFLLERGLTNSQVGLLQALLYWTIFIAEIPTGIFGDKFGRRYSLLIGLAIMAATGVGHLLASAFFPFVLVYGLTGMGFAFLSGSDTALLYDSMKVLKREDAYVQLSSRMRAIASLSLAIAIAIGGCLQTISWSAVFGSFVVCMLLGTIVVARMQEIVISNETAGTASGPVTNATLSTAGVPGAEFGDYYSLEPHDSRIISAIRAFLSSAAGKRVLPFVLASALLHAGMTPYFIFAQELFQWYSVTPVWIALIIAVVEGVGGLAGLLAGWVSRRWSLEDCFICVTLVLAVSIALNVVAILPLALALFVVSMVGPQVLVVLADNHIQERLPSAIRASALSMVSFVECCLTGVMYIAVGRALDFLAPNIAISLLATTALLSLVCARKYFGSSARRVLAVCVLAGCGAWLLLALNAALPKDIPSPPATSQARQATPNERATLARSEARHANFVKNGSPPGAEHDSAANPQTVANSIGMKLVLIPAGDFWMGSTPAEIDEVLRLDSSVTTEDFADEQPRHRVRLTKPFYLQTTEVTVGQFRQFVNATDYQTEAEQDGQGAYRWNESQGKFDDRDPKYNWRSTGFAQDDHHPVVNVTWNDAVTFCKWLTLKEGVEYRLPTEAEWEYSCRAGTETAYYHGDDPEGLAAVGNVVDATAKAKWSNYPSFTYIKSHDNYVFTAPVAQFRANAFGLYDMHGNVYEWCTDWYDAKYYEQFASRTAVDPTGPSSARSYRVLRGGSWYYIGGGTRSAGRLQETPCYPHDFNCGFRVARTPTTP